MSPSHAALMMVLASACGSMNAGPAESTTLHIGHRVGGGRVARVSSEEIAVSVGMYADLELFEPDALEGGGYAREADQIRPAVIQSALSSDETTLRIDSFRGSFAKIEGMRPGTAEVTFDTDRGVRTFRVHVAEPALVQVHHFVWDRLPEDTRIAFALNGIARFEMTRRDMAHRVLGGYGAALPVRVDPPRAARLSIRDGDVEHVDLHLEEANAEVTLRPLGGHPVTFAIVAPSEQDTWGVSAIDPDGVESELEALPVGRRALVTVWSKTSDGTRLLGVLGRVTLMAVSPEVCEATSFEDVYGDGVYRISALSPGDCQLEVQIGDTALAISFPIEAEAL
jgi:hypothetical protein